MGQRGRRGERKGRGGKRRGVGKGEGWGEAEGKEGGGGEGVRKGRGGGRRRKGRRRSRERAISLPRVDSLFSIMAHLSPKCGWSKQAPNRQTHTSQTWYKVASGSCRGSNMPFSVKANLWCHLDFRMF